MTDDAFGPDEPTQNEQAVPAAGRASSAARAPSDLDAAIAAESEDSYHPIVWKDLTLPESQHQWAQLRDWLTWLRHRYSLRSSIVPDCWYRHGWLVEELSALHTAWQVSFDLRDSGLGPILWHEKFAATRSRIRDWQGTCSASKHEEDIPSTPWSLSDATWDDWTATQHP